jgi:hypothetical protein
MQHFSITLLALAIGVNAIPNPAPPFPTGNGMIPPGTFAPFPSGPGFPGATGIIKARKATSSKTATKKTKTTSESGATSTEDVASTSANVSASASPSATGGSTKVKAAAGLPASSGTSALSAVKTIAAGESFDGGMVMYDRGVSCTGQTEGGGSDAVFVLEKGASISNVIIGRKFVHQKACSRDQVFLLILPSGSRRPSFLP